MKRKNVEIKARCSDFDRIRKILKAEYADFRGIDEQNDTYFHVKNGILKLRESVLPFERGLMYYERSKKQGPKVSDITVYDTQESEVLKEMLADSLSVVATVTKKRELFTIDNVKFHLDTVDGLGTFIEIEAQDTHGIIEASTLRKQCLYYMRLLQIKKSDLLTDSYKDLSRTKRQ